MDLESDIVMAVVRGLYQNAVLTWIPIVTTGLALIGLSIPAIAAHYTAFRSSDIVDRIFEGETDLSNGTLRDATRQLAAALEWQPSNWRLHIGRASLYLRVYENQLSGEKAAEASRVLGEARGDLIEALKLAPGNANNWYLLAAAEARLRDADRLAIDALEMSFLTGEREGWIAERRIALSLQLWPFLKAEMKRRVRQEIRSIWENEAFRPGLVEIFLLASDAARKVIVSEIDGFGIEEIQKFENEAKRRGWQGEMSVFTVFRRPIETP